MKERIEKLQQENELLKTILSNLPLDVYFKDQEGRYQYLSNIYAEVQKAVGNGDIVGKTDYDIMPKKELADIFVAEDQQIMESQKGLRSIVDMPKINGEMCKYYLMKEPIRINDENKGVLVVSLDVTEECNLRSQIENYAIRDQLTGLYNRNHFSQICKDLSDSMKPNEQTFLVWLDADNLKCINDIWGHVAGDDMLKIIATSLQMYFPEKCDIFRIGGDEFALFVYDTSESEIQKRLTLMADDLKNQPDFPLPLSISSGIVAIDSSKHMDDFVVLADQRMYQSKLAQHQKHHTTLREYVFSSLIKQGCIDEDSLSYALKLNQTFGEYIGLSEESIADLEYVLKFHGITNFDFSSKYDRSTKESLYPVNRHFILTRTIFDSLTIVIAILSVHNNWHDDLASVSTTSKEIPYYSRIARIILEVVQLRQLPAREIVNHLCDLNGSSLDPSLCELMSDFLLNYDAEDPKSQLIRNLNRKYQTNTAGLKQMLGELPFFVFFKDLNCRYQIASNVGLNLMRKENDPTWDIFGKNDYEVFDNTSIADIYYKDDLEIIKSKKPSNMLVQRIEKDDSSSTALICKTPIWSVDDSLIGICGIICPLDDIAQLPRNSYKVR